MKLTFLGTGTSQGVPVIGCKCTVCQSNDVLDKRLRTAALFEHNGTTIALDAGPDFRQQMLSANVTNLNAILLTHEHRDHIAGLDDVRAFNFILGKAMDVWAEPRVQDAIRNDYAYAFEDEKYPGSPNIILHDIDGSPFSINGIHIQPIRAYHCELPIYAFRIENISYITDANLIPDNEKKKLFGTEYLVINALRKKKHISHFTLDEALSLIQEIKPRKAFITHISHQMGIHADIQKELPCNVFLASDGLSLEL